jgi:hypothetical protein
MKPLNPGGFRVSAADEGHKSSASAFAGLWASCGHGARTREVGPDTTTA